MFGVVVGFSGRGRSVDCCRVRVRALLIDEGINRSCLTAASALLAAGWEVGCAAPVPSLVSRLRGVRSWHELALPSDDGSAFVGRVAEIMCAGGYDVVFPASEEAIMCLSAGRGQLPGAFPFAAHVVLERSLDKHAVGAPAAEVGLGTPRTVIATAEELARWEAPLVLKPATHSVGAEHFASGRAAIAPAQDIERAGVVPLAQECVVGVLMAFAAVADRDGRLVSVSQQRAEHVWPTAAGVTARGVSVPVDPELRDKVAALIARLGWFGLFQLQFLVDDQPRLIDFNGRWYGSMALALRAGVNHPDTWGRLALDAPIEPAVARPGVRYQWFTRDVRASVHAEHPVRELARAAVLAPQAAHSVWSPRQPLLAPRFLAEQAIRTVRRRL